MRKLLLALIIPLLGGCWIPHPVPQGPDTWEETGPAKIECWARTNYPPQNASLQVNVVPTSLSHEQIVDITWAMENVQRLSGVEFIPVFSYVPTVNTNVNVYRVNAPGLSRVDWNVMGNSRRGGNIYLYNDVGILPVNVDISTPNAGFRKMMVQRFLNILGLRDLTNGPDGEIMSGIFKPSVGWGRGTLSGALQSGCFPFDTQRNIYNFVYPPPA